ncbi:bile acid:sodium symporter family protein [Pseudothioclava nitratireducens]|jgi:BASS family bile acid:Na+ symporter|uniref:bile acid:sodium symporter family protein n=1 Tax=Pseudothioclava nitratireducens TaxID=1928646 RepID=UPI0023DADFEF|nr:bile acid:sodium symporter [Defluviimonas nitratireducens]MDF1618936.1 bile acid:sodium symporter [Defluviimonas nitratireducens]
MSSLIQIFLPAAMMVLMLALGLRLRPSELGRAFRNLRAYGTGLAVQLIGLPLLAFGIAKALDLSAPLTLGLMLVAASPGGVTSNYVALLARGSVGLSVAMTLTTSLIAPLSLPLVLVTAGVAAPDPAQLWKISMGMTTVALVPLLIGIALCWLWPLGAERARRLLDPLAKALFALMVLATFAQNWGAMREAFAEAGLAVTLLAIGAPLLALGAGRGAGLSLPQIRTVMTEASLQNVAITIFVATQLLGMPALAIPGLIYAVLMNVVALALIGQAQLGGFGPSAQTHRG